MTTRERAAVARGACSAAGLETFAKVRALHDRTTNAGEKASAAARMKVLAGKAGMTVEQAMSKLDAPKVETPAQAAASAFSDFFNTPEFRARQAEREAQRRAKCADLLKRYGSEDAVFADTERETALREACAPLTIWDPRPDWKGSYTLKGWPNLGGKDSMPAEIRAAVMKGWSWPETVAAAWGEFEAAEKLDDDRCAFEPAYEPHSWVRARAYALEDLLDTLPAKSLNDLRARLSWMEHLNSLQCHWTHERDSIRLATLRADVERLGQRIRDQDAGSIQSGQRQGCPQCEHPSESNAVQSGHGRGYAHNADPSSKLKAVHTADIPRRTNADKRRDVLALLDEPGLSDREIARRAGVSPTTVGTIRRTQA